MNEVSCRVLPVFFHTLAARGIPVERLFEGLPVDPQLARKSSGRIDWNDYALLIARFEELIGGPEEIIAVGRSFTSDPRLKRIFLPLLSLAVSPPMLLRLLAGWWGPSLFANVRNSLEWVSPTEAALTLSLPASYADSPAFFRINIGAFEATGFVGASGRPAKVTCEIQSRCAVYRIRYEAKKSLLARSRSILRSVLADPQIEEELFRQQRELSETFAALQASEERYRLLLERTLDGIWRLDIHTRRFEFSSNSTKALTGYSPEEMMRLPIEKMFLPEDVPQVNRLLRDVVAERRSFVIEIRHVRKDGSIFWGEVHGGAVLNDAGDVIAIQGVTRDVTARKEAEAEHVRALAAERAKAELEREVEERRKIALELAAAKEQAEASLRLKDSILANLSHEIRTPLTALIGFSQLLGRRLKDTEYASQLQIIQNAGQRLLILLNNMLDLARLDADKFAVAPRAYPLADTVQHVCELLSLQARDKGLELQRSVPADLFVFSDPRRDEQIFLNIVGNAIRFTDAGHVRIAAHREGAMCVVRVSDTGIGISAEFLPYVFDEFRQESEGLNRGYEGSGLGLALSKKLVELLGGSIRITSEKNRGTTVEIRLPAAHGQAANIPAPAEAAGEAPQSGRRLRLFLIEDDPVSLQYVAEALAGVADIHTAKGADEALLYLRGAPPLDGILLDINLKGSRVDGIALLGEIRQLPAYRRLPITAMTAYAMPGDRDRVLQAGFNDYLAKPVGVRALHEWAQKLSTAAG